MIATSKTGMGSLQDLSVLSDDVSRSAREHTECFRYSIRCSHSIALVEQYWEWELVISDKAPGKSFAIRGYAVDRGVEMTELFGIVSKRADLCHTDWSESTEIEKEHN